MPSAASRNHFPGETFHPLPPNYPDGRIDLPWPLKITLGRASASRIAHVMKRLKACEKNTRATCARLSRPTANPLRFPLDCLQLNCRPLPEHSTQSFFPVALPTLIPLVTARHPVLNQPTTTRISSARITPFSNTLLPKASPCWQSATACKFSTSILAAASSRIFPANYAPRLNIHGTVRAKVRLSRSTPYISFPIRAWRRFVARKKLK